MMSAGGALLIEARMVLEGTVALLCWHLYFWKQKQSIVVLWKGSFSSAWNSFRKDDLKQKKHYPILEVTVSKAH